MNRALPSLHGEPLEITLTVPLIEINQYIQRLKTMNMKQEKNEFEGH